MPADLLSRLQASLGDRYRVERELGRGGMATVFLAHDLRRDRPVALKAFHPQLGSEFGERFLREIRVAAKLSHPHILTVHDSGEADGLLWYTMPVVDGRSSAQGAQASVGYGTETRGRGQPAPRLLARVRQGLAQGLGAPARLHPASAAPPPAGPALPWLLQRRAAVPDRTPAKGQRIGDSAPPLSPVHPMLRSSRLAAGASVRGTR